MKRIWTVLPTILISSMAAAQVPNLPDLDVTYIQRIPRNMGVGFNYPNDIPVPVCTCITQPKPGRGPFTYHPEGGKFVGNPKGIPDPNAGKPITEAEKQRRACQHWPKPGQTVTFIGHVMNHGDATAPAAPYVFLMDGKVIGKGKIKSLASGEEATPSCKWKWSQADHWVEFKVTPQAKEICDKNNSRKDMTTAIALTMKTVDRPVYDAFAATPNQIGSYSFEDWCQYHIDNWNKNLAAAVYPSTTPHGVTERIRLDGIYPPDSPDIKRREAQGETWTNWTIGWDLDKIPQYASNPGKDGIDGGLVHELCHQCGIIDLYMMGLSPANDMVRRDDGKFVWIGGWHHQWCLMGGGSHNPNTYFSEHTAAAFQAMKGWPRWGYGIYLFDVPEHNIVRILDNRGKPIVGAQVKLHMQSTDQTMGKIPAREYKTSAKGEIDLEDFPFAKLHVVGWSGMNLLEIRAFKQVEYHFIDVTQMNIAYWRGDKEKHTYITRTGIAPEDAPAAPLAAEGKMVGDRRIKLSWRSDKDPTSFRIYFTDANMECHLEPPLRKVAELPGNSRDIELNGVGTYAVVTVDDKGRESAYSRIVRIPDYELIPYLTCPWSAAYGPDGTAYTFDTHQGNMCSITAKGEVNNWKDYFSLQSGDGVSLCISPDGKLMYIAGQYKQCVHVIDLAQKRLVRSIGDKELKKPFGVAAAGDGSIFVADSEAKQFAVFGKDGKRVCSIDGFKAPRGVAYDNARGLIATADYETNDIKVYSYKNAQCTLVQTVVTNDGTTSVAFGPGGKLYVGPKKGGMLVFDAEGRQIGKWLTKPFASGGGPNVYSIAPSPDGSIYLAQGNNSAWFMKLVPDEIEWNDSTKK